MIKGFVFGKFSPFHKGHESLINFAITQCDYLSIIICVSNKETLPGDIRKRWIQESFKNFNNIDIIVFNYDEDILTNTSVSSKKVSEKWSIVFKELVPSVDVVITSEPYGNYVANFMNIKHIIFDIEKKTVPISSTAIKNNIFSKWNFLPNSVKPYYCIKVIILGTESTGKSTLTKQLAAYYNCNYVLEAGRDIIPDSTKFEFNDLHIVADEHASRIRNAVLGNSPLVIIDTDIHITKSYARFVFNKELKVDKDIYNTNLADLYLYLNNDVTYVQDGTRLEFKQRNNLDKCHRKTLIKNNITITEIEGNWQDRFLKAIKYIDQLIQLKTNLYQK